MIVCQIFTDLLIRCSLDVKWCNLNFWKAFRQGGPEWEWPFILQLHLYFLDFLDHLLVGTETLAIWRDFLSHGPGTTCWYVSQRRTYATLFPCKNNKTTGRVYLHNLTKCAEPYILLKISTKYLLKEVEHLDVYVVEIIRFTSKE